MLKNSSAVSLHTLGDTQESVFELVFSVYEQLFFLIAQSCLYFVYVYMQAKMFSKTDSDRD